MNYSYEFRIYPNKKQKELIQKTFGCCRFVYNYFLNRRITEYEKNNKNLTLNECSSELTKIKHEKEYSWLNDVDCTALHDSLKSLDMAFVYFFRGIKSNKKVGFPKFKKKKYKNKYKAKQGTSVKIFDGYIRLPKLGKVKCSISRPVLGRILNATVKQSASGKYFVSICCTNIEIEPYPSTANSIGIDLGIKHYLVTSNGDTYESPKYFQKSEKRLSRLQRSLSRKPKGSKRHEKARVAVAKAYEKISNQRKDFLQKLSTKLVKENDLIVVENLNSTNLRKNRNLSKAIEDASWHSFVRMIQYKSLFYKKVFVKTGRFYPSSQLCSNCGFQNKEVKNLKIRKWTCPVCGSIHDRDVNAAKNILEEGKKQLTN